MPAAYTLYGELKADTQSFKNALRDAESRLESTKIAIDSVESRATELGRTTAVTGRQFDRLRENVAAAQQKLDLTAEAFRRGDATAGQMRTALLGVDRATAQLNSRLADSNARLTDFKAKMSDVKTALQNVASGLQSLGTSLTASLTVPLTAIGYAAVRSATSFDDLRNKLQAAVGGVEKGAEKFRELNALAQKSPGVMTDFAVELYALLKPLRLSDEAITGLIKSFGRIKLQQPTLDVKQFSRNLQQMFTTFDRQDFKEAFEQFPRFGEIVAEKFALSGSDIASVKEGLQELKNTGKLTYEQFIQGFNEAIAADPSLGGLQETISTRMAKAMEKITLALEPLGKAIAGVFERIMPTIVVVIEQLGQWFSALSPTMQTAIVAFGALAVAIGPVLIVIGGLISAIVTIGGAIASAVAAVGGLIVALPILAGFVLFLGEIAAAAYLLHEAWQTNFGGIQEKTAQVWEFIKAATSAAIEEIKLVIDLGAKIINGNWEGAWNAFLEIVKTHTKHLTQVLTNVLPVLGQWGLAITKKLGEWAVKAIAFVVNVFANLPIYLLKLVPIMIKAGLDIGNAIWQGVQEGLGLGKAEIPIETKAPSVASLFDDIAKATGLDKIKDAVANMPALVNPTQTPAFAGVPVGAPPAAVSSASDGGMLASILTELQAFHKSVTEGKTGQLKIEVTDKDGRVNGVKTPTPDDVKITYGTYGTAGGLSSF